MVRISKESISSNKRFHLLKIMLMLASPNKRDFTSQNGGSVEDTGKSAAGQEGQSQTKPFSLPIRKFP